MGKSYISSAFFKGCFFLYFSPKVRRISFVDCSRFCTCLAKVETWSWAKKFAKSLRLCIWGGNIQMIWDLGMSYNNKLWCYGFGGIYCFVTLQVLTPFKICSEFWCLHLNQVAWYKVGSHFFPPKSSVTPDICIDFLSFFSCHLLHFICTKRIQGKKVRESE